MQFKLLIFSLLIITLTNACTEDTEDIIPNVSFTAQLNNIATDPKYTQDNPIIVNRDSYGNLIGTAGVVIFMITYRRILCLRHYVSIRKKHKQPCGN